MNTPLDWFDQTMLLVAVVAMAVAVYLNAALKRRLFSEEIKDSMSWREAFEGMLYKLPPDASAEFWRLHVRMRFTVMVLSAAMTTVFLECTTHASSPSSA